MLGAEVRQRGSAGGGGALLLKRIGGRPPRPHARRPWRADPKPSAESRWWVGLVGWSTLFSPREQGRARAPVCARCPRHPRHLSFPGGAALGALTAEPAAATAPAACVRHPRTRVGSCNHACAAAAACLAGAARRRLEATCRRADGCSGRLMSPRVRLPFSAHLLFFLKRRGQHSVRPSTGRRRGVSVQAHGELVTAERSVKALDY